MKKRLSLVLTLAMCLAMVGHPFAMAEEDYQEGGLEAPVELATETGVEGLTVAFEDDESLNYTDVTDDEPVPEVIVEPDEIIEAAEPEWLESEPAEALLGAEALSGGVEVDLTSLTLGEKESYALEAHALNVEGEAMDGVDIVWSSANAKIAKVDAHGRVTGVKRGGTTIYASAKDVGSAAVKVTVVKAPSKVVVTPKAMELGATMSSALSLSVNSGSHCRAYTCTSSNKSVATVDADGVVTGISQGTATITVKTYNGRKATCKVTVYNQPAAILPESDAIELCEDMTKAIRVRALDEAGKATVASPVYTVDPESGDPDCVSVDPATGEVTGLHRGEAVIRITAGKIGTAVNVCVLAAAGDMALKEEAVVLGEKEKRGAIGYDLIPREGETECAARVTWISSNPKVAKVDANTGAITGGKKGQATITARTHNGIERNARVTVGKAPHKLAVKPETLKLTEDMTAALAVSVNSGAACGGYTYMSSNADVATVDGEGRVTGHATGTATITVKTYNGKKATCKVEVLGLPRDIALAQDEINLVEGQEAFIKAKVTDAYGVPTKASYTYVIEDDSENPACVSISSSGEITALERGSARIRVTSHNGLSAVCLVNVVEAAADIVLNASSLSLGVKERFNGLSYTLVPKEGAENCAAVVTWKSSAPKVAEVDARTGAITALKKGKAVIAATTHNGHSAKVAVTVGKAPGKLTLKPGKAELSVGMTLALDAAPGKGEACCAIVYSSSDTSVAEVSPDGVITAIGRGKATITAESYNHKKATCAVTVYAMPASVAVEASVSMLAGQSVRLNPAALDADGYSVPSGYSYMVVPGKGDSECVSVNADGTVTGRCAGSAVVRVGIGDEIYADCAVTVNPAAVAIALDVEDNVWLGVGEKWAGPVLTMTPPEGYASCDAIITWTSSDAKVAKVNAGTGAVTGVKTGTATITATTHDGIEASYNIKVLKAPGSLTMTPSALTLNPGMAAALSVRCDSGAASREVAIESSDTGVATVNDDGVVTAIAPGRATITATAFNGKRDTCVVTVYSLPAQVRVNAALSLGDGETAKLEAAAIDENGLETYAEYTYDVIRGGDVASVDGKGVVTGLKPGNAVIRVTTQNGVHTHVEKDGAKPVDTVCHVTVTASPASITMASSKEIEAGQTFTLKPVVKDSTGKTMKDVDITWSASGKAATVDEKGVVTGVRGGTATVTARTCNGCTASCVVTVQQDRYRFFGAYNYYKKGEGALYFPQNNAQSVRNVLKDADIQGVRYDIVGLLKNPSKEELFKALDKGFSNSKDSDINVIYLCSHGINYVDVPSGSRNTHYGMLIPGYSGYASSSKYYMTAEEIFKHISAIRGRVVLILDSCYSGEFITNMYSKLQAEDGRIAVMTAASNTRASYYNITDTGKAYDYFTYYLLAGAGYDMSKHSYSGSMPADKNKDGYLTFNEMFNYANAKVLENVPKKKNEKTFHGNANQAPRRYVSGDTGGLVLFAG